MANEEVLAALRQELRRGSVVLVCLLALRKPGYGYSLLQTLESAGMPVDANTLYPLMRRLERQGLVTSEWVTDDARPRKYYQASAEGLEVADLLLADLAAINESIDHFKQGDQK